jgi:GAF domain-containing protein
MLIKDPLSLTTISAAETRQRVAVLQSMAVLDTPQEPAFDALARLAAGVCETPMSVVSLIDGPRVWFKAAHGIDIRGGESSGSFCLEAANRKQPLEVCNSSHDARFATGPWAEGGFGIQYYAGAPIMFAGVAIGAICAADRVPRRSSPRALQALEDLALIAAVLLRARIEAFEMLSKLR